MTTQILGLKQALPYLRKFRNSTFVVKIGGSIFNRESDLRNTLEGVAALHNVGIKIVVVHGGGPQLETLATELGVPQNKVAGRRVTSAKTLELAKMVFGGTINTDLVAMLNSFNAPSVGLSGLDGSTIVAIKRPPVEVKESADARPTKVDYGFVGDVVSVNMDLINDLLEKHYVPVIASLAGDASGQILNVNADTIACQIAIALKAKKYINITNAPGILRDVNNPQSVLSYLDIQMIETLKNDGVLSGGMLPKAASCVAAIKGGVERAHIINGQEQDSVLKEIFTNEGCGTLIVERIEKNVD